MGYLYKYQQKSNRGLYRVLSFQSSLVEVRASVLSLYLNKKFLRLANYYRQFVKDFAKLAKLLHKLVRKNKKWNWGEEQKVVFKELKRMFMTRLVLVAPDLNKEMGVEANALKYCHNIAKWLSHYLYFFSFLFI